MNRTRAAALGALLAAVPVAGAAQDSYPTTPPRLGPAPAVNPPVPVQRTLANGMKVMFVRQPELPVVSAALVIRGAGTTQDPAALPGLASFTASMLDEGAAGKSSLQIADALDLLGANLSTSAAWDAAYVNLYVLRKNFPAALRIMSDVVVRPDFPVNEVQRVRDERVTSLTRAKDEPQAIAANAFSSLVYGAQHPYGRFATVEGTRTLDRARVQAFHGAAYRPENATLILVGDVDAALQAQVEQAFGAWRATGTAPAAEGSLADPQIGATTIYLVDKPGAAQSEIRIGHPGVRRNTPDFFALQVLNTMLGGSFTSRLNTNLRETHGYAYGAGSSFDMRLGPGPFVAAANVQTDKTAESLTEFFNELTRIGTVPAEELDKAKSYVALGFPQEFETTQDIASKLSEQIIYGLPDGWFNDYVGKIQAVTPGDVARAAKTYITPGAFAVVVVGDLKAIEAKVRALNLGPVRIVPIDDVLK